MSIKLKIVPWLEPLIDSFWKNKSQMMKDKTFDFPDYGGLPKDISKHLTPEHVDFLQENIINILGSYRTKTQFARRLIEDLTNGFVSVK